jgi:alpha-1,2-mannosyltransferase
MHGISKSARLLESQHARRVLQVSIGVVLVVFAVGAMRRGLRPAEAGNGNDLTVYLEMSRAMLAGEDPVAGTYYLPFTAVAFLPLYVQPAPVAHAAWYAINVGCLLGIALLIGRYGAAGNRLLWPFALTFAASIPVLQNHLLNGQINLPVVLACILFFHWHRQRPTLSALALAVAISLKLSPAILLGYLVFRRSYVVLGLTVILTGLLNLLPCVYLGTEVFTVLGDLGQRLTSAFGGRSAIVDKTMFFTVSGFLHWAGERLGWITPGKTIGTLKVVGGVIVLGGLCMREWKPGRQEIDVLACYLAATLLLLPVSETHHLVFLFPALLLAALQIWDSQHAVRWPALAFFATVVLLLVLGRLDRDGPCYFLAVLCLFTRLCLIAPALAPTTTSVEAPPRRLAA